MYKAIINVYPKFSRVALIKFTNPKQRLDALREMLDAKDKTKEQVHSILYQCFEDEIATESDRAFSRMLVSFFHSFLFVFFSLSLFVVGGSFT